MDVLARTAAYRAKWPDIQNKTGIQLSDLVTWDTASARMLHALGERALPEQDVTSANLNRQRAFTLFVRAYYEVRDALSFLRRKQNDVDELVPSLNTARNAKRKRPEVEESEPAVEPPVVVGNGTNGLPVAARALDEESPFVS